MIFRLCNRPVTTAAACLALLGMLLCASCSSTSGESDGLPTHLPDIRLAGSSATPPHSMASYEYPFDSGGRYVSDWAAEGERRAGRSASATSSDSSRWGSSHGGSSSSRSKSSTSSKAKSSKGGRSYTVKKGDTLSHIAARHGSSVKKIMAANGMKSDFLSIGRVLRIP
jgi:hypothetical protein